MYLESLLINESHISLEDRLAIIITEYYNKMEFEVSVDIIETDTNLYEIHLDSYIGSNIRLHDIRYFLENVCYIIQGEVICMNEAYVTYHIEFRYELTIKHLNRIKRELNYQYKYYVKTEERRIKKIKNLENSNKLVNKFNL